MQPDERAVLIADRGSPEIAAALAAQLSRVAGEFRSVILEDVAERSLRHLPMEMEKALEWADVSLFTANAQPGELAMRRAMTSIDTSRSRLPGHAGPSR